MSNQQIRENENLGMKHVGTASSEPKLEPRNFGSLWGGGQYDPTQ